MSASILNRLRYLLPLCFLLVYVQAYMLYQDYRTSQHEVHPWDYQLLESGQWIESAHIGLANTLPNPTLASIELSSGQ